MTPTWNCTVAAPVFIGAQGLPAVALCELHLEATLQVLALGPGDVMFGLFDGQGDPLDCWFMPSDDPLNSVAHLLCKVLAGFSEPAMCPPAAAVAERFPSLAWKGAAADLLHGMRPGEDQEQLWPGLLDPETGLPRPECVSRVTLVRVTKAAPETA